MNFEDKMAPIEERFNRFTSKFNHLYYSNYYMLLLLAIAFLTWLFNASIVGMVLLGVLSIFVLVTNKDISPVLPIMPLMLMVISSSAFLKNPKNIYAIVVAGVLFSIGLFFNIIFYRHRYRGGKLTISFVLISVMIFIGGIGSKYIWHYFVNFHFMISLGPMILAIYVYATSCIFIPKDVDARLYFTKQIVLLAFICALQILVSHIRIGGELIDHFRAVLNVGWTNRAGLVIILMLGLGSAFYLADENPRFNFILYHFAFALYLAIMMTSSRGGMLFGTLEMIALTIYLFVKSKHKIKFSIVFAMWAIAGITILIVKRDFFLELLDKFKDLGLSTTGRTTLFKEAIELFKQYPILGVGFGFRGTHYFDEDCLYWFHSTILQVLASMGIIGGIVYTYYYVKKFRILFAKRDSFSMLITISLIAFELHSLIDAGTFEPLPFLYMAVLMNTFVELVNRKEDDQRIAEHLDDMANKYKLSHSVVATSSENNLDVITNLEDTQND